MAGGTGTLSGGSRELDLGNLKPAVTSSFACVPEVTPVCDVYPSIFGSDVDFYFYSCKGPFLPLS